MSECNNVQGFLNISKERLEELLAAYLPKIQERYKTEDKKRRAEIRERMAKPRLFGLIKGNPNPTDEEMNEWVKKQGWYYTLNYGRLYYQERIRLYEKFLKLLPDIGPDGILINIDDLTRLKEGW